MKGANCSFLNETSAHYFINRAHATTISDNKLHGKLKVTRHISPPAHLKPRPAKTGKLNTFSGNMFPLLRLKLTIDQYNYDDIAIAFDSAATTKYNYNLDSEYLPGIDAPEGLFSLSSDNVPLSINIVPLPKQQPLVIRLGTAVKYSGLLTLERTELDSIPPIYEIWLMDKYKKDSLDLRANANYVLNVDKNDTASFGSNRFSVVIRQNPALGVHLLSFNAAKEATGAQMSWTVENEQNYTGFSVERSTDGGANFSSVGSSTSNGAGAYSFTDPTPPPALNEYRLKITDLNGTVTYSNTITLIYGTSINIITNNITIYPNPAGNSIHLLVSQNSSGTAVGLAPSQNGIPSPLTSAVAGSVSYSVKIIDIRGTVVQNSSASSKSWQNNVGGLAPGTYIVTVVNNSDSKLVARSTFVKL